MPRDYRAGDFDTHTKVRSVMDGDTHPSALHCVPRKLTPPHRFSCPTRVGSCPKSKQHTHKKLLHVSAKRKWQALKLGVLSAARMLVTRSSTCKRKRNSCIALPTTANGIDKRSISVEESEAPCKATLTASKLFHCTHAWSAAATTAGSEECAFSLDDFIQACAMLPEHFAVGPSLPYM